MILSSLIWLPVVAGLLAFASGREAVAKALSLAVSLVVLVAAMYLVRLQPGAEALQYTTGWLGGLGSSFSLYMDGASKITVLLTAFSFPIIFLAGYSNTYEDAHQYYGLMLLAMAGLMGVFLSADALLFYFFWELALIPVYFLCSKWGGERRIPVTFKFFIYTFAGSVLMLIGIIYLYNKTPDQSFAWSSFKAAALTAKEQAYFFWFFLVAFAIKMPIFPFHTWQPDTYETSPTTTTMVLSGVMVKMGLFAVIRWLLPVFPGMSAKMGSVVILLSLIGILYASLIAMRQNDLKRLVAYSSIAHIGLMSASLFAATQVSYDGVLVQMFNHGINIIGLWIVIDIIEQQTGVRKMDELGGLARTAPWLTVMLVLVAFANIALPLTNAFVGEFMMFNGLWQRQAWYAVVAGISIILAAVYTLGMIQKVFLGISRKGHVVQDLNATQALALTIVAGLILLAGLYPKTLFEVGEVGIRAAQAMVAR